MTIQENFNPVQINYSVRRNGKGEVLEKSLMINIRTDDTKQAIKLYGELKSNLNGELTPHADSSDSLSSNASSNSANLFPSNDNVCPRCGGELRERRSKTGNTFLGCSNYPSCRFVKDV